MSLSRTFQKNVLTVARAWHKVDATDAIVGRLAANVSVLLQGKHKPVYNPSMDLGDHVVVVNAKNLEFTGSKWKNKMYQWHTGYIGNMKERSALEVYNKNPSRLLIKAVLGMLPKNSLRGPRMARLHIYPDEKHPHLPQLQQFAYNASAVVDVEKGMLQDEASPLFTKRLDLDQFQKKLVVDTEILFERDPTAPNKLRFSSRPLTPEEIKLVNSDISNLEAKLKKKKTPKLRTVGRPGRFFTSLGQFTEQELQKAEEFVASDLKNLDPKVLFRFLEDLRAKRPPGVDPCRKPSPLEILMPSENE